MGYQRFYHSVKGDSKLMALLWKCLLKLEYQQFTEKGQFRQEEKKEVENVWFIRNFIKEKRWINVVEVFTENMLSFIRPSFIRGCKKMTGYVS